MGTLLNESKVAGNYQYRWTPNSDLASGIYLFELKTKNKTRHQKITYIKQELMMNKKYYMILNALLVNATIFAQGVTFPSEPAQAPIGGLGLLVAGGADLRIKNLKNKYSTLTPFKRFFFDSIFFYIVWEFAYQFFFKDQSLDNYLITNAVRGSKYFFAFSNIKYYPILT